MSRDGGVEHFRERFRRDGASPAVTRLFHKMYEAYRGGASGHVSWEDLQALGEGDLVEWAAVESPRLRDEGAALLGRVVWIVLNGGLGTSMRMDRAKSLVPVREGLSFLDLLARHVFALRERCGTQIPLVFMNSYATREDTLAALASYPRLQAHGRDGGAIPLDFVQHRFPRIRAADGLPFGDPKSEDAWAPPGHGDLYLALQDAGLLDRLLGEGIRWAFVSNADNLGAGLHSGILGFLAQRGLAFALEVTDRTAADVKGGTLVRNRGRLELLEIAQVPEEHREDFQDPRRFPVFNTNNLWLDLAALRDKLSAGGIDMPLIVNRKVVGGTPVVQLETAMGAAIGCFDRSVGIRVPRSRFAPVKTTDDLVVRRSDLYRPGESSPLAENPGRDRSLGPPLVRLDPEYFGSVDGLELRVPHPLGLLQARALLVKGDVRFGEGVRVEGEVRLENLDSRPLYIEDGAILTG
jgi:UTP--glucose-1-phosphate uridylyltransferase